MTVSLCVWVIYGAIVEGEDNKTDKQRREERRKGTRLERTLLRLKLGWDFERLIERRGESRQLKIRCVDVKDMIYRWVGGWITGWID